MAPLRLSRAVDGRSAKPAAGRAVDGRQLRARRNRAAIAAAMLELYRRGTMRPSARQIAAHSRVSLRTVFHQFADLEALRAEIVRRQFETVRGLAELPPLNGPLFARAGELVRRRAELFEALTPVRRVAMIVRWESPTIAATLDRAARLLRAQVARTFAPELAAKSRPARADLLEILDAAVSWEVWERMRTTQRLTRGRTERILAAGLTALFRKTR